MNKKESFFRFDIIKRNSKFKVTIGCQWDSGIKSLYIPFEKTAFKTLFRNIDNNFDTSIEAQKLIKQIKEKLTFRNK